MCSMLESGYRLQGASAILVKKHPLLVHGGSGNLLGLQWKLKHNGSGRRCLHPWKGFAFSKWTTFLAWFSSSRGLCPLLRALVFEVAVGSGRSQLSLLLLSDWLLQSSSQTSQDSTLGNELLSWWNILNRSIAASFVYNLVTLRALETDSCESIQYLWVSSRSSFCGTDWWIQA